MQAQKARAVPPHATRAVIARKRWPDRLKEDMRLTNAAAGDATNVIRTLHKADPCTGTGANPAGQEKADPAPKRDKR